MLENKLTFGLTNMVRLGINELIDFLFISIFENSQGKPLDIGMDYIYFFQLIPKKRF